MDFALILVVVALVWLFLKGQAGAASATGGGVAGTGITTVAGASSGASLDQNNLDNFLQAIFHQEGDQPGDLTVRQNNPGALRYAPTESGSKGGFATFADVGDGWDALTSFVTQKAAAHPDWNFFDFFNDYAPASDGNDPVAYANYVAAYMGVDPNTPVSQLLGVNS